MIKHDKDALSDYLRGCKDITELALKETAYIEGDTVVSAHIDLRHADHDIVIVQLRIDNPVGRDEKMGDTRFMYRTIQRSEGIDGFSPSHLENEAFDLTKRWSLITGDRIRYIRLLSTFDETTKVRYAIRVIHEIFFRGGVLATVQYRYDPDANVSSMSTGSADSQISFSGVFSKEPRNHFWRSPFKEDIYYPALTHPVIHSEIDIHEHRRRYWRDPMEPIIID